MFNILGWILFGLIVGAVARLLVPGRQDIGLLKTTLLGVAGSFVGGAISWVLFGSPDSFINPAGWIMSIIGAVVIILLYTRVMAKA